MKPQNIIEDVLIGCGITISLVDIQQILSIVLLIFNVVWLVVKLVVNVYEKFKQKDYHGIVSDIKETTDAIQDLSNGVKDSKDNKDGKERN